MNKNATSSSFTLSRIATLKLLFVKNVIPKFHITLWDTFTFFFNLRIGFRKLKMRWKNFKDQNYYTWNWPRFFSSNVECNRKRIQMILGSIRNWTIDLFVWIQFVFFFCCCLENYWNDRWKVYYESTEVLISFESDRPLGQKLLVIQKNVLLILPCAITDTNFCLCCDVDLINSIANKNYLPFKNERWHANEVIDVNN